MQEEGTVELTNRKRCVTSTLSVIVAEVIPTLAVTGPTVSDHEPSRSNRISITVRLCLALTLKNPPEQSRKEFQNAIDSVFMLCVPLPSLDGLLPKGIV